MNRKQPTINAASKRNVRMTTVEPTYLGVNDAERMTGLSRWTWRAYCYQGKVESCKVGSRLLIPLAEVRRVLAEGTRPRVRDEPAGELDNARAQERY